MAKYCWSCKQELAGIEGFESEYTYCRSSCCRCCPDAKVSPCQKEKLDKDKGTGFFDITSWGDVEQ